MTNEARITRKIPGVLVPAHGLFVLLLATGLIDIKPWCEVHIWTHFYFYFSELLELSITTFLTIFNHFRSDRSWARMRNPHQNLLRHCQHLQQLSYLQLSLQNSPDTVCWKRPRSERSAKPSTFQSTVLDDSCFILCHCHLHGPAI